MIDRIIATIAALAAEGMPYRGFHAGLMIDADGNPRVVEFNCRFGDLEAQPALRACEPTSWNRSRLRKAGVRGARADPRTALAMAAGGHPASYDKGAVISGLRSADAQCGGARVPRGIAEQDGEIVTSGGRVLCVVGIGDSVTAAASEAYGRVVDIGDAFYRRDIGHRAIARESSRPSGDPARRKPR